MVVAAEGTLRYIQTGHAPRPADPAFLRPWDEDLAQQARGGSAQHYLIGATVEYLRGSREAQVYILDRLRWEIRHGLMAHEMMSPSYGDVIIWCVSVIWWEAWHRGDEEVSRLAGAWLERVSLLACLLGVRSGNRILYLGPGFRADAGSVPWKTAGVSRLLGLAPGSSSDAFWGPVLESLRFMEGLETAVRRVRKTCLQAFRHKQEIPWRVERQVRLLVPMKWHTWPSGDWFAWTATSSGAHDPPCMGGGVIDREHAFLWPFQGENPPEAGWRAEAKAIVNHRLSEDVWSRRVEASWYRKSRLVKEDWITLPPGPAPEIIGSQSGPDPLADLPDPPPRKQHPWRQGGRPGPGADPEPKPEPRKPVDVEWDLGDLRSRMRSMRDTPGRPRWEAVTLHRALATLDRLGAWEGLEEE